MEEKIDGGVNKWVGRGRDHAMDDPVNFTNPSSLVPCVLCLKDPHIRALVGQEHKAMGGWKKD